MPPSSVGVVFTGIFSKYFTASNAIYPNTPQLHAPSPETLNLPRKLFMASSQPKSSLILRVSNEPSGNFISTSPSHTDMLAIGFIPIYDLLFDES